MLVFGGTQPAIADSANSVTLLIPELQESTSVDLYSFSYTPIETIRDPITFNEPVRWHMRLYDGVENYSVRYSTPAITVSEQDVLVGAVLHRYITFGTDYAHPYYNITYTTFASSISGINLSPNYNYTFALPGYVTFTIPELLNSKTVQLTGTLLAPPQQRNISNVTLDNTTNLTLTNVTNTTLNSSINTTINETHNTTNVTNQTTTTLSTSTSVGTFNISTTKGIIDTFSVTEGLEVFFSVSNLTHSAHVNVSIDLPFAVPEGVFFYLWKNVSNTTIRVPYTFSNNRSTIVLELQDGVIDDDGIANGVIVDPLKLHQPSFTTQVNKIHDRSIKATFANTSIELNSSIGNISSLNIVDPKNIPILPFDAQRFSHKMLKFSVDNLPLGGSTDIYLNTADLPEEFELWKFNPNTLSWYSFPYERVDEETIRLVLIDGGLGDDDGIVNGIIEDDLAIVEITRASHLDENRTFIVDIYDEVSAQDNLSVTIPENDFVRVTFERKLTSLDDITLYAQSNSSGAYVEVYEENGTEIIATFASITAYDKYQVLLTELPTDQNTFDLKVVNGPITFDYILDPNWWNTSWRNRVPLNLTNVVDSTLTNFPTYINVTGLSDTQADFGDLRFINGSCGSGYTQELDYEIENYTTTEARVWLEIPNFVVGVNQFCVYYNNSAAANGDDPAGTWNSNYVVVQHLNESPGDGVAGHLDSTSNGNTGTALNFADGGGGTTDATGIVDGTNYFAGDDDAVSFASTASMNALDNMSAEVWFRIDDNSTNDQTIFAFYDDPTDRAYVWLDDQTSGIRVYNDINNVGNFEVTSNFIPNNDEWYHAVWVIDGTLWTLYVNGADIGQSTQSLTMADLDDGFTSAIGRREGQNDRFWGGYLDEYRISNVVLSQDWINQTYEGIANYDTVVSIGTAQSGPGVLTPAIDVPANNTQLLRTTPFVFNGTVTCSVSSCGNVSVDFQYLSTATPLTSFVETVYADFITLNFSENITLGSDSISLASSSAIISSFNWWNGSWSQRSTINITNEHATALTNFPAYLNLTYISGMDADYDDLRFTNGSCGAGGTEELGYEISTYNTSHVQLWVNVSNLEVGTTSICMYFDNSVATAGSNSSDVWGSTFTTVNHLDEDTKDTVAGHLDSTGNGNAGTPGNFQDGGGGTTDAIGILGGADYFAGDDDEVDFASSASFNALTDMTSEIWFNIDANTTTDQTLISYYFSNTDRAYLWLDDTTNGIRVYNDINNDNSFEATTNFVPNNGQWYHIAWVVNGTDWIIYIDGEQQGQTAQTLTMSGLDDGYDISIGRREGQEDREWGGYLDEYRVSNVARSQDWINQSYQMVVNQGLVTQGSAETLPYAFSGEYISSSIDTGGTEIQFENISWESQESVNGSVTIFTRSSSDNSSWSAWFQESNNTAMQSPSARYLQYKAELNTSYNLTTPVLDEIVLNYRVSTLDWTEMLSSGSLFTTDSNPYECGIMSLGEVCSPNASVLPTTIGDYAIRLYARTDQAYSANGTSTPYNVSVFIQPTLTDFTIADSVVAVTRSTSMQVTFVDEKSEPLVGYPINFTDLTGNGTDSYYIGMNVTDSSGIATIYYTVPANGQIGSHTLQALYEGNNSEFILTTNTTNTVTVSSIPQFNDVNVTPSGVGIGFQQNVTANVTDTVGIDSVMINITNSSGSYLFNMTLQSGNVYNFTYNNYWYAHQNNFTIIANNTDGITETSSVYSLDINGTIRLVLATNESSYQNNQIVYLDFDWYSANWSRRLEVNVTNTYSDLFDYQVLIEKNLSEEFAGGYIQENCGDVRFTYKNSSGSEEVIPYYMANCNLSSSDIVTFWAQIPELLNDTVTYVYMYFGANSTLTTLSNESEVFTYSEPTTVAYVVNTRVATGDLIVASMVDNNNVTVDGTSYGLDKFDVQTILAASVNINTTINATDLFSAHGDGNSEDMIVPASWAGTEFFFGGSRHNDNFCMLSPWGNANVSIYEGETLLGNYIVDGSGRCENDDVTDGSVARVASDIPILVYADSTNTQDGWVYYPATNATLWGPSSSGNDDVATGLYPAVINCYGHSGGTGSTSLDTFEEANCPGIGGGADGTAPGVRVETTAPIGVISQADGDGGESTVWVPTREMGTLFGAGVGMQYVVWVTPYEDTTCNLVNTSGIVYTNITTGTNGVHKGEIRAGQDGHTQGPGWTLECDNPVWIYFEQDPLGDEVNTFTYPQMRQFVYPTPEVSISDTTFQPGLQNYDRFVQVQGYLRMLIQEFDGSTWSNIVPPIVDLDYQVVNASSYEYIHTIFNNAGGWNTTTKTAGSYRVAAILEGPNREVIVDDQGNVAIGYAYFVIANATLSVTNLTYENLYNFNLTEYDVGDTVRWINVTVNASDNIAYDANVTLAIYDDAASAVGWGPQHENKSCGDLNIGDICERRWDNGTAGYIIPEDASAGSYDFSWNVTMDTPNGPTQINDSNTFIIHYLPGNVTTDLADTRIEIPNSTQYFVNLTNPWSTNLSNVSITINCPSFGSDFNCTTQDNTSATAYLSTIGSLTTFNFTFNITAGVNVPTANYEINITLNYTNPGAENKSFIQIASQTLEIRTLGVLEITNYSTPANITRDDTSTYNISAYFNNTGSLNATNTSLNYTLPTGFTITAGNDTVYDIITTPGELVWNNISVTVNGSVAVGPATIQLDSLADDGRADFITYTVDIYAPSAISASTNQSFVDRGTDIRLIALLTYDNGSVVSGHSVAFNDTTENHFIGNATTNASGHAVIDYSINSTAALGLHTISINFSGNRSLYLRPTNQTVTIDVHVVPSITGVQVAPNRTGFGQNISVSATLFDADDIDDVDLIITDPSGTNTTFNMVFVDPVASYIFNDTWVQGIYNAYISANDTLGSRATVGPYNFTIESFLTLGVQTINTTYAQNEYVNLTDDGFNTWYYPELPYRRAFNISNTGGDQFEYQVLAHLNLSGLPIQTFCEDVRFAWYNVSNQSELGASHYVEDCNLSASNITQIWVQVPFLENNTNTSIYMYYGNEYVSSTSNITATFDYDQPRRIGYVVSNDAAGNGLTLLSMAPNITVEIGTDQFNFTDNLSVATLDAADTDISDEIRSTGLVMVEGNDDEDEPIVPISWAFTNFTYAGMRNGNDAFCMLSPWGTASVTVRNGTGGVVYSGTVDSSGSCFTAEVPDGSVAEINTSLPVLAFKHAGDSWLMYNATTEPVYGGSASGNGEISAGVSGGDVTIYGHNTASPTNSNVPAGTQINTGFNGGDGSGEAVRVNGTVPIGVITQGDGDGGESTTFAPESEMMITFGSSLSAEYIVAATPHANTTCTLSDINGYTEIQSGSSANGVVYQVRFAGADNTQNATGPWSVNCNNPVWPYYEQYISGNGEETNLLGHKQMRQYTYPSPTITSSLGIEEHVGSRVYNLGDTNSSGFLTLTVQKYNGSSWNEVTVIVNDTNTNTMRQINSSYLFVDTIWNPVSWFTGTASAGIYRAHGKLTDPDGTTLVSVENRTVEGYYVFNITEPSVVINISDIRVYDVTNSLPANRHVYVNDFVGSGLNTTYTLSVNNLYRLEIDIDNVGSSDWNISQTNVTYDQFNAAWVIDAANDVWYSNLTSDGAKRADSTYEDGLFNGTVTWNTTLGGSVGPGNNATFYVIVNTTTIESIQVLLQAFNDEFTRQDYSIFSILDDDTEPPVLFNNTINFNPVNVTRGQSTLFYARWNETINAINITYSTTTPVVKVTKQNTSAQQAQNWTNFTITTASTWFLGNHVTTVSATDLVGNNNNTNTINFTVWGNARMDTGSASVNYSNPYVGETIRITCRVTDTTNSSAIPNYMITFSNSTGIIGVNLTNNTGYSTFAYTDSTPGSENIYCSIAANTSTYHMRDNIYNATFPIVTREAIPPTYSSVSGPLIAMKGQNVTLSAFWQDNFALDTAILEVNRSGETVNESTIALSGTSSWANFTYEIPDNITPGNISWQQYANDTSNNYNNTGQANITVYGYSTIATSSLSPSSMQITNTTWMSCTVLDADDSRPISGYTVNFWQKLSASPTYLPIGSNNTNGSGVAIHNFSTAVAGTYDMKCNVSDAPALLYNITAGNESIKSLNVVSGSDATPPAIVGANYTVNETDILRNACFEVSGLWDEAINFSYVQYNISGGPLNQVNISGPYTDNWTNVTICTNNTWDVGNHTIKLFARDIAGNVNSTLEYKYLVMRGRSRVTFDSPTGNINRTEQTLICNVTDDDTGEAISGYNVTFFDGDLGGSIGSNLTNSSGQTSRSRDYTGLAVGPDDLSCSIATAPSLFYVAQAPTLVTETVYFYGELLATILAPANNTVIYKGSTYDLLVNATDELGAVPLNHLGAAANIDVNWTNTTSGVVATTNSTTWGPPSNYSLGPNVLSAILGEPYYYYIDIATINVTIYSYANITLSAPSAQSYPDNTVLPITCQVVDNVTGDAVSGYPVNFYNDSGTLATNNTNAAGTAIHYINTNSLTEGAHTLGCEIFFNSTLYYNVTNSTDNVSITIDKTNPSISYNPTTDINGSYARDYFFVNVSATDTNIDTVRLYINGTPEAFVTNVGTNYWSNKSSLADGTYTFYGWVNDTAGNTNQTAPRQVIIDTTAPILTAVVPQQNFAYPNDPIQLIVFGNENLNSCVYTLDGAANVSMNSINATHFNLSPSIPNGPHTINYYCNDTVDNTGSVTIDFYIDSEAVNVTLQSPLNDTNTSNALVDFVCYVSDNVIVNNVSLYGDFNGSWALNETNSSGINDTTYTFQKTLNDGTYNWNCQACDNASCYYGAQNYTITIDTTDPVVTIVHPINISYDFDTIDLNFTVVDATPTTCWYNLNGGANITVPNCANITLGPLAEGYYNLTLYANDSAGNIGSDVENFSVDVTAPQLNITSPVNESTYTETNAIDFNFSVIENLELDTCWYSLDGGANTTLPSCANTTLSGLLNQNHTLILYANDSANNVNSTEIWFVVNVTNLIATPESPSNNEYINTSSVRFNVTTNEAALACNYTVDDLYPVNMTNTSALRWTALNASMPDAAYNVTFTCSHATNVSTTNYVDFTVDTVIPTLTLFSPQNITYATSNVPLNYSAGDLHNLTCQYSLNGGVYSNLANCINTTLSMADGYHNITLRTTDLAGNMNATTLNFSVDTTAPGLVSTIPLNISYGTDNLTFTVDANETINSCVYTLDGAANVSMNAFNNTRFTLNVTVSEGAHTLSYYCNDTVNNTGSVSVGFTVDLSGPVINFISPTPTDGGGTPYNWVIINVSLNEDGDVAILEWTNASGTTNFTMTQLSARVFQYNVSNQADGTDSYRVHVNDTVGNDATSANRTVVISTAAPVVTIHFPINNEDYNLSILTLNVSGIGDIVGWTYQLNGENFTFTPNTTFTASPGSNALTVYALDSLNRTGSSSITFDDTARYWGDNFTGYSGIEDATYIASDGGASNDFCWPALQVEGLPQDEIENCWHYRKQINVTTASATLQDHQVYLEINLSDEVVAGSARSTCDDLRFTHYNATDDTESEMNYWIESCNSLNVAQVWVNVPEINTTSEIYVYYGNNYSSSLSNGSATFEFFDDFSINVSEATWGSNAPNWNTTTDGVAYPLVGTASGTITAGTFTFSNAYATEFGIRANGSSGQSGYYDFGNSAGSSFLRLYFDAPNNRINLFNGGNNYHTIDPSIQRHYSVIGDFSGGNYSVYIDHNTTEAVSLTTATGGSANRPRFRPFINDSFHIDYIAVRNYDSDIPAVSSLGSEETPFTNSTLLSLLIAPPITPEWDEFIVNATILANTDIDFEIRNSSNVSICGTLQYSAVSSGYDLFASCSAIRDLNSIYLFANMTSNISLTRPVLVNWSVNWSARDILNPDVTIHEPVNGSSHTSGNNVTILVTVTDDFAVDVVLANVSWNSSNNYEVVTLNQIGGTDNYSANFTNTTYVGNYTVTIIANDTRNNINDSEFVEFSVIAAAGVDLVLDSIVFSDVTPIEDELINFTVNISNNGSSDAGEFTLRVNISYYNGTSILNESLNHTFSGVNASEYVYYTFNWTAKIGTFLFTANADFNDSIAESNETNNILTENISVSVWHIYYGDLNYAINLEDANSGIFYNWTFEIPTGTTYYSDSDASYSPFNLAPLNGSADLYEADAALGIAGLNDSLAALFDVDDSGSHDTNGTFTIGGLPVTQVPIINTTNSSTFITGLLYDTADGVGYNGTQDLVIVTKINYSQVGSYGTYDYEVRVPASLERLVGGTNSLEKLDELG